LLTRVGAEQLDLTGGPLGLESITQARVATQTVLHDADHPSRLTLTVVQP
jgi:hypothetical protein